MVDGVKKSSKTIDIVSYAFLETECKWCHMCVFLALFRSSGTFESL